MKIILSVLFAMVICARNSGAQDHCSLIVRTMDPNGREVLNVPVRLQEKSGRTEEAQSRRGGVRFCDLGILSVNLTVGDKTCNEVTVRNIPLEWGETRTVRITYDAEACRRESQPPIFGCEFLFRFVDEQGKWVPGVSLSPPPLSSLLGHKADTFGRYRVGIELGKELNAVAIRDGYIDENVQLACNRDNLFRELIVTLRRKETK